MENFKEFKARYLNPLTDFGFHKIFGTEANKGLLIDFLNEVIKGEGQIIDIVPKLKSRPASVGGKIFDELFDLADIKRLTTEDMETYKSSVLEYYDVQSAMMCAREEGSLV